MYFKRNESYRFVFNQAVAGKLTKLDLNNRVTTHVEILDVSSQGAKLSCPNTIDLTKGTKISLAFLLNATPFQATGVIVWVKKFTGSFELGVHLNTDNEYKESMTRELKLIAKEQRRNR
ncbi:MAG TPA: PilZ domain-containing protein [Bacillota bacterium]|nr:PilZ domain-containing protein [Bacillota bacterium]